MGIFSTETAEWAARRAVNILSEQHQTEQKALAVNLQTSYGPKGRGFESLVARHKAPTDYCGRFVMLKTTPAVLHLNLQPAVFINVNKWENFKQLFQPNNY